MRFLSVWDGVINENTTLKVSVFALSISLITIAAALAFTSKKPALVVERSCFSKVVKTQESALSKNEIEAFLKMAVEKRFNTEASEVDPFLSLKQRELRRMEQDELKNRNMKQAIFVNQVKIDDDKILLDCDRLISVGEIRSAFSFKLIAKVEATYRSETNPYGLVLVDIDNPNKESRQK